MDIQGSSQHSIRSFAVDHKAFTVEARLAPGLFRIRISDRVFQAKSSLELLPGERYKAALIRTGKSHILQISGDSLLKPLDILLAYAKESGLPDDTLSRAVLKALFFYQKIFDGQEVRQVYLQLRWLLGERRPGNTGEKGSLSARETSVRQLDSLARTLWMLQESKLDWNENKIARFISWLYPREFRKDRPLNDLWDGSPQDSEDLDEMLNDFNLAAAQRSAASSWVILPLEDKNQSGTRAWLRFCLNDREQALSCSIGEWLFLWYNDGGGIMYCQPPVSMLDEDPGLQKSGNKSIAGELLNYLESVNFKSVEIVQHDEDFDPIFGFSGITLSEA